MCTNVDNNRGYLTYKLSLFTLRDITKTSTLGQPEDIDNPNYPDLKKRIQTHSTSQSPTTIEKLGSSTNP